MSPNMAYVEVVWRARACARGSCAQVLQLPPTEGCGVFSLAQFQPAEGTQSDDLAVFCML